MKKFSFSLEKLKGYKNQILETEKNVLAVLRNEMNELLAEKENLERKLKLSSVEYAEKSAKGISVLEISVLKNYHKALTLQIAEINSRIDLQEDKIRRQLSIVVDATKECSSLDKLEEKQLEEYKFVEAKQQEQFIEEYVLGSSYR